METYFEYKLWTDFYVPMILLGAFIIVWVFIGFCKFIQYLKDKRNERINRKDKK